MWKLQTDDSEGDVITMYKHWRTRETWERLIPNGTSRRTEDGMKMGNFGMDCERDIQSLTVLGFSC